MKTFSYVITDPAGIHARPAGLLVKEANKFSSTAKIKKGGKDADLKKIFGVMGLAAKKGDEITIELEGADENEAINSITSFIKENL